MTSSAVVEGNRWTTIPSFDIFPSQLNSRTLTTYFQFNDIEMHVCDRFTSNKGFSSLQTAEPDYAAELISGIITKSSRVFLWVVFVVRLLLEDLASGDKISNLEAKSNLPANLESLCWRMLGTRTCLRG